ncbi:MAG: hypothetical protein QM765_35700 [Myxococcales bacterium]
MSRLLSSTALLLALCGCPSPTPAPDAGTAADTGATTGTDAGTSGPDGGAVRSTDLSELCGPIAAWECARAKTCGCTHPSGSALDEAWCKQVREGACIKELTQGLPGLDQGLAQGAVSVRVDRVPACIAAYEAGSPPCTKSSLVFFSGCADTLELTVAKGGESCPWPAIPCGDGTQCTSGGCLTPAADGAACQEPGQCASRNCLEGKCAALGASGARCARNDQCAPPRVCFEGKCAALLDEAAACTDTAQCTPPLGCVEGKCAPMATCTAGEGCGNEGRCIGPVSSACRPAGAAGADCTSAAQCAAGTACDTAAKKCVALPGDGEACLNASACAAGFGCLDGPGTCSALGGVGSTCLLGPAGPFLCASGAVCGDSGSCIADPKEGEPCGIPNACGSGLVCAFGPGGSTCVKPQPEGTDCQNDICATGLFCDFNTGKCAPSYSAGDACSNGNECGPARTCEPDDLQVLRCQALPAVGEPCFFDCVAGAWCERGMTRPTCQAPLCVAMYQLQ